MSEQSNTEHLASIAIGHPVHAVQGSRVNINGRAFEVVANNGLSLDIRLPSARTRLRWVARRLRFEVADTWLTVQVWVADGYDWIKGRWS